LSGRHIFGGWLAVFVLVIKEDISAKFFEKYAFIKSVSKKKDWMPFQQTKKNLLILN
jgi:hypothetical protein